MFAAQVEEANQLASDMCMARSRPSSKLAKGTSSSQKQTKMGMPVKKFELVARWVLYTISYSTEKHDSRYKLFHYATSACVYESMIHLPQTTHGYMPPSVVTVCEFPSPFVLVGGECGAIVTVYLVV